MLRSKRLLQRQTQQQKSCDAQTVWTGITEMAGISQDWCF